MSAWRQIRAIALLPGVGTLLVPSAILLGLDDAHPGWGLPFPLAALPFLAGGVLLAGGLTLIYTTISLLARRGRGTLAPWDPTQRLVSEGPYRHVRNPMISGVLMVLLGEASLAGSGLLLGWALVFWAVNAVYFPLVEEPGLVRRFGDDYVAYKQGVARWIPRRRAWKPE